MAQGCVTCAPAPPRCPGPGACIQPHGGASAFVALVARFLSAQAVAVSACSVLIKLSCVSVLLVMFPNADHIALIIELLGKNPSKICYVGEIFQGVFHQKR